MSAVAIRDVPVLASVRADRLRTTSSTRTCAAEAANALHLPATAIPCKRTTHLVAALCAVSSVRLQRPLFGVIRFLCPDCEDGLSAAGIVLHHRPYFAPFNRKRRTLDPRSRGGGTCTACAKMR